MDKLWYVPLDYLPRQKNIYYTYFDDPLKPRSLVYSACKRLVESQADKRIQPFYGTYVKDLVHNDVFTIGPFLRRRKALVFVFQ